MEHLLTFVYKAVGPPAVRETGLVSLSLTAQLAREIEPVLV